METSALHESPVFSPSAELRDALTDWSMAIDALREHEAGSGGNGNPDIAPLDSLIRRISSARLRCELLLKFNPRSAFAPVPLAA